MCSAKTRAAKRQRFERLGTVIATDGMREINTLGVKDGERLIVEPVKKPTHLLELLATLEPIEDDCPDVDAGLPAPDDVRL
jgi:hypothetical protein